MSVLNVETKAAVFLKTAGVTAVLCALTAAAFAQTVSHAPDTFAQPKYSVLSHMAIQSATRNDNLHIAVGQSIVLTSTSPLRRVYIGNPAVLQTFTSGTSEVVLTAKAAGVSSMVLWDDSGIRRLYTVMADLESDALRTALEEAFPGSAIHAESVEGRVNLTGTVPTEAASEAAVKLAQQYTKEVVNSLRVVPLRSKQVQLKLRIVEVDRTRLEQFGINFFAGGRTPFSTSTQQFGGSSVTDSIASISDPLNLFLYSAKLNVGVTVKDLEQKQILQVLAEPTLTTISGLAAKFLSGGEFPFPVVQGGTGGATAITLQFRPYGVRVDFTPTVNADGSIRLKVAPEVSTLDYSNAVTISGFTVPAISTRRAETEVEIKDGQSFVVSGLLDHRTTDSLSKTPGISSIPILGQLFRSKGVNHSVTELVVIVTATVIDPIAMPADPGPKTPKFVLPTLDTDVFDATVQRKLQPKTTPKP